jgi:hypothetical protein
MLCLPFCYTRKPRLKLAQGRPSFFGKQLVCGLQLRLEGGLQHQPLAQALLHCHPPQEPRLFSFQRLPALA